MPVLNLTKSPLNEVVGSAIERLRKQKGTSSAAAAQALGVSKLYLRAIELGTRALPANAVMGLTSLGIEFQVASELLALVQYLDHRIKGDPAYNLSAIEERIVAARPYAARFEEVFTWFADVLRQIQKQEAEFRRKADLRGKISNWRMTIGYTTNEFDAAVSKLIAVLERGGRTAPNYHVNVPASLRVAETNLFSSLRRHA